MEETISEGNTLTVASIEQEGTLREPVQTGDTFTVIKSFDGKHILAQYHDENPSLQKRQVTAYEGDSLLKLGSKSAVNFHQMVTVE